MYCFDVLCDEFWFGYEICVECFMLYVFRWVVVVEVDFFVVLLLVEVCGLC